MLKIFTVVPTVTRVCRFRLTMALYLLWSGIMLFRRCRVAAVPGAEGRCWCGMRNCLSGLVSVREG